ncbi:MAG: hypothetical protein WDZ80_00945 [Candidatus Paceibacterota bacterium]
MNKQVAKELARKFLCKNIELEVYSEEPPGVSIYPFDPKNDILISFSLFEEPKFGPSKYIIVSKIDGTVRYIGHHGD